MREENENPTEGANEAGERLAAFSVRRPVTLSMLCVSLVVMGLIAATRIPLVMLPDVSFPFLFVWASYPNSSPEEIQKNITQPLEEVLSTIPGVKQLQSDSTTNEGFVRISFDWGTDVDLVRAQVREKIDQIRNDLPEDLREVQVRNFGSDDIPIIEGSLSAGRDLRSSYDFLDTHLKKPLLRLPGVADVEFWGVDRQRIDIYLRLDDIKRYPRRRLFAVRRLDDANLNMTLGTTEEAEQRYSAVFRVRPTRSTPSATSPSTNADCDSVDIADIEFGNPPSNFGRHLNGQYGVGFTVRKSSSEHGRDRRCGHSS
ncbi:MAG: efflux RND transporter permease subunit [Bryobacterales bacterium]